MAESTARTSSTRNVALDNLRVVAMLLGLVTHGVLPYTATGVAQFPIRDHSRHIAADACYFAVHDFRMQLFFLLAGFAGTALASSRGIIGLVRNRLTRVALPMLLAILLIGPAMQLLFARHTATRGLEWDVAEAGGWLGPNFHLWFLYYLLMCCVPLVCLMGISRRLPARAVAMFDSAVRSIAGAWWKIPVFAALAVPILWDMPAWWIDTPKGWLPDVAIYAYYLGFFLAGAALFRHRDLLPSIGRRWTLQLVLANLLVLPVMFKLTVAGNWAEETVPGQMPPWLVGWKAVAIFLGGLYTWLTIAGLLGLFQRCFAGSAAWWKYLSDSSYWCYLAGFPIQAVFQVWFAPRELPIVLELLLINALTFAILLVSYEYCVRHSWIGLLLNGKRPNRRTVSAEEAVVVSTRIVLSPARTLPAKKRAATPTTGRRRRQPASAPVPNVDTR